MFYRNNREIMIQREYHMELKTKLILTELCSVIHASHFINETITQRIYQFIYLKITCAHVNKFHTSVLSNVT